MGNWQPSTTARHVADRPSNGRHWAGGLSIPASCMHDKRQVGVMVSRAPTGLDRAR